MLCDGRLYVAPLKVSLGPFRATHWTLRSGVSELAHACFARENRPPPKVFSCGKSFCERTLRPPPPDRSDAIQSLDILAGDSTLSGSTLTIFDGAVENFDAGLFDLVNHSDWAHGWRIFSDGQNLVLTAVPEPGTLVLLAFGLLALLPRRRRR